MATPVRHLFGPVPSRRLGRSLGIDPVPMKTCTFDCIYCQLGRTTNHTDQRAAFVPAETVIGELETWIVSGGTADYITLSGSGEPTLNTGVGEIIAWIKEHTNIPVVVLTNGSLLWRDDVRREIAQADFLMPDLDAVTPEVFAQVNRPCCGLQIEQIVEGLVAARRDCASTMWLEVMLCAGLNDTPEELAALRAAIDRIEPDEVQINTVVRPPSESFARPLSPEALKRAQEALGPRAEIIVALDRDYAALAGGEQALEDVLALLTRRPCTMQDIATGLSLHINEVSKHVSHLLEDGKILAEQRGEQQFYRAVRSA